MAGTVLRRNVLGARARHAARRAGHAGPRRGRRDGFTRQQIEAIRERAIGRGEQAAEAEQIITRVVAPLMYGVLFANQAPSAARMLALVREVEAARRAGAA